ncbi:MAG: ester cyclase [Alphaproteobacteria bacterium]|nr:ester cyclase [Alphaproteobacteria bacterium]
MPTGSTARLVERFYAEVWNAWSTEAAEEVLAENLDFRGSFDDIRAGRAGFLAYRDEVRAAFPDFVCAIQSLVADDGGRAAARMRFHGTHRGVFWGVAPTGRRIDYAGAAFFTGDGAGKIGAIWVLGDLVAVRRQLGLDG